MSYLQLLKLMKKEKEERKKVQVLEEAECNADAEKAEKAERALSPTSIDPLSSRYAHPFPDSIDGLGPRHAVTFTPCSNCGVGTWAAYGWCFFHRWALCLRCANLGRP